MTSVYLNEGGHSLLVYSGGDGGATGGIIRAINKLGGVANINVLETEPGQAVRVRRVDTGQEAVIQSVRR